MTNYDPYFHRPSTAKLSRRIDEGESPQDLLAELVQTACRTGFTLIHLLTPLQLLISHGARVATSEKDCAFETLLKVASLSSSTSVFSDILNDLVETPGELPLHIVARDAPGHLLNLAFKGLSDEVKAALQKRDPRGRTVSHWLWAPDGLMVEQANRARAAIGGDLSSEATLAKLWRGTICRIWKVQQVLHEQGVGMEIPDHDGVTAMDLCLARIEAEDALLFPEQDICCQVKAYQDRMEMDAATAPAGAPKAGLRL